MPVIEFYLGQMSDAELTAAANGGGAGKAGAQVCQLDYYLGEWRIFHGLRANGIANLKEAVAGCPKDLIEYGAAEAELKRVERAEGGAGK